ncbi:hypothetical protein F9C07_2108078 [Aspergillus flavus]|uniref:Uncharacterized protein n=1 Tax=Aspergillus flavus (strain ATCC 200026 / FGSC A1120 / IAM 13836 / NRRL 3357 / JCM 12722 / SRRC 167) TaxID=332952 RepID=A0A7U2MI75_ASPFN|nr:hypothetical protein F9C07_2108078 [Aspergillus flavus]
MMSGLVSPLIFAFLCASTVGAVPPGTSNPNYSGTGGTMGHTGSTVGTGGTGVSAGGPSISLTKATNRDNPGKTRQQERFVEGVCAMEGDYGMCHGTDANGNDWTAPCNPKNRCKLGQPRLCNIDTMRFVAVNAGETLYLVT